MNLNQKLYYQMKDGRYMERYELETAFYITHGYYAFQSDKNYLRWLHSLLGKTIVRVVREYDMQVDELAKSRPILAMGLYRDRYGCSLREAREYVNRNITP